jgi:uncharacterized protein YecE (DUF72 family)
MVASMIYIGISGWRYAPWRGTFYPKKWPQRRELEFASRALSSIELNGSFYGLQTPASYLRWYAETPSGFVFSIKGSRTITHECRLVNIDKPLADFFASGLVGLKEKLGPILWQLPPSFVYNHKTVENFLKLLPRNFTEALAIPRPARALETGEGQPAIEVDYPLRHCLEVRHPSFLQGSFVDLLRKYRVGLVIADAAGEWPYFEDLTADFVYIRLHGDEKLYSSGYTEKALTYWATRIRAWSEGKTPADSHDISTKPPADISSRDVFCYLNNSVKVKSPFNARQLIKKLGLESGLTEFVSAKDSAAEQLRFLI